jgi:hypothetical protein
MRTGHVLRRATYAPDYRGPLCVYLSLFAFCLNIERCNLGKHVLVLAASKRLSIQQRLQVSAAPYKNTLPLPKIQLLLSL